MEVIKNLIISLQNTDPENTGFGHLFSATF